MKPEARVTPSDPVTRLVDTSVGPVCLADEGPRVGPAIVMIHGVPGSHRDFRYLAPLLSDAARVVRVDLPGMGGTPLTAGFDHSLEARAKAVLAAMDALELDRVVVVGHSMGGGVAVALADLAPGRVAALALLASTGPRRHRGMRGLSPWLLDGLAWLLTVPGIGDHVAGKLRERWRRAKFPNTDSMTAADLRFQLKLAARMDFAAHGRRLARLRLPALVAYTEDDHLVEGDVSRAVVAAIQGALALPFPDGGHNLQKTRARAVAAGIRDVVSRAGISELASVGTRG